ncbi:MAG TPA: amino acid ABC transporter substrate-binding protein [Candidatus Nanopelagicaceae bacterium]|nr:amino acid ABC transporter substrate-binding protein [Candidatus Nanopelagicaceae bacterium]
MKLHDKKISKGKVITAGSISAILIATSFLTSAGAASAKTKKRPILVGVSLSLTGDFSADGIAFKQGYTLWAKDVNHHGGLLGRKVKLDIVNDASSPVQVATNYQKLISVDHVNLVFGPFSTGLTKAASKVVNRYGYAFVEGAGGGPSVFTLGLHNVFDVSLPVANNLVSFAKWISAMPAASRPKTAAYATEDDPFTAPQLDVARAILEKAGVKTVYNKTYPSETTDYTPIAAAIISSKADVVLLGTLLPDFVALTKQFIQQNYNPKALVATAGPDQGAQFTSSTSGVGTNNTEGILVPNAWAPTFPFPGNAALMKEYVKVYGGKISDVSSDVAEGYSVGQVVAQAVKKTHSLNQKKLLNALHKGTFTSVQGGVKFDKTGQNTLASSYLFQWQNADTADGQFPGFVPNSKNGLVALAPSKAKIEFPKHPWGSTK